MNVNIESVIAEVDIFVSEGNKNLIYNLTFPEVPVLVKSLNELKIRINKGVVR